VQTTAAEPAARASRHLDELVRDHLPLVGHMVRELLYRIPAHVNRDDLVSAGMTALVTAARGFDADRGTPFGRFAASRIRGALLDELRSLDWASRSVRVRARRLEAAEQQLTSALGRTPSSGELAGAMGVSVEEIGAVEEDVQRAAVLSLQGFTAGAGDDVVTEREAGPEELLLHRERLGYLAEAVRALPERLRVVITGWFLEERPMSEIATQLEVTESRVSQLRGEALSLLRDGLNAQLEPDLVSSQKRPDGCVARRREAYYAEVAGGGDLRSRLRHTDHFGLSLARTA